MKSVSRRERTAATLGCPCLEFIRVHPCHPWLIPVSFISRSRMARILLATFGSLGDLHPMLALAQELRRRGHRAEIATSEFYREKISGLGFVFHPLSPNFTLNDESEVRRFMEGRHGPKRLLVEMIFPAMRAMHAELNAIAAGADLIVATELVYAAPLAARRTGARWVSCALAPIWFMSAVDPSLLAGRGPGAWLRLLSPPVVRAVHLFARAVTHSWWRPLRDVRRELGLPSGANPFFEGKHSPCLNLALFSPALQSPQPDWPAHTVQCGFPFYDEGYTADGQSTPSERALPPHVENFLAGGEPPIVFTLGSAAVFAAGNFYAESARASQLLGRRALLLLGKNSPPPELPPTILAWDYLPYAQIFPRAAAIIHQGGIGTTAQALRAGRPMLVVPFAFDQFDNAARVTRLGVARTISRAAYNGESAARALAALLNDPQAATRAANLGAHVRAERGAEVAADAIEQTLR